jgi:TolB-like protein/Tfp pilus assembly protein PilF
MSLFSELKRRNVFRVGAAYIVVAWLIIQVAETIFPLFDLGNGPARLVVIILAIGFVPALSFSWLFELTPQGLMRENEVDRDQAITVRTAKRFDRTITVVLVLALAYFVFDKFVLDPQRDVEIAESATEAGVEQAREDARLGMFSDKSVAVLPFTNRSDKQEDKYFTDGMHDELLTRLSRIAALKVISRTSVMRYRDTEKSIPEIANELSVATVLEGGVQRSGNQVRINVQLIDARTDEHLWADIFDRELTAENLFAIQSEISTAIADALHATLSPEENARVYDLPTTSLEAYNHYLRGRQLMASRKKEDLEQALEKFELSIGIDPDFALAWVGVADASHLLVSMRVIDEVVQLEVHKHAAETAIALNDQLGEAYVSLSAYYMDIDERDKAITALQKAIELNPNNAQAYHWYAILQSGPGATDRRLQLLYKAAQLDPVSSILLLNIGSMLFNLGRVDEARQQLRQLLEMDPDFALAYEALGDWELRTGQLADAIQLFRKGLELDPSNGRLLTRTAGVHIALGDFDAVADLRKQMDEQFGVSNGPGYTVDYDAYLAQSEWAESIKVLDTLQPPYNSIAFVLQGYTTTYVNSGNFQKAREYLMKLRPFAFDRELWQQEYTGIGGPNCDDAGILIESGDESLGQDLLQFFIRDLEERSSDPNFRSRESVELMMCYLLDGSFDKAVDILDRQTVQGRLLEWWWYFDVRPWWDQLADNPRYIDLTNRIDFLLAEQRELLEAMNDSRATVH